MHARTRQVGTDTLTISAQSPDVLDAGADAVLDGLALVRDDWRPGFATEFGAWLYSVDPRGASAWQVQAMTAGDDGPLEPGGDAVVSRAPQAAWTDDATRALVALSGQEAVLARTGLAPEAFRVDDLVLVHVDLLPRGDRSPLELYLHRMRGRTTRADGTVDSGWYLGAVEGPAQTDTSLLAFVPALQVLEAYEFVAPALRLPRGSLVLFDDGGIFEVVDVDGRERWPRDEA